MHSKSDEVRETLALFRSLPTSVIRDVCFPVGEYGRESARVLTGSVLRELQGAGLVDSGPVLGRELSWWLTRRGCVSAGFGRPDVVGPHLGEFEHDMAVVRVWRVLCDPGLRGLVVPRGASGVVDVEEVVTERVMGGLSGLDGKRSDFALPLVKESGKAGFAWPDLVTVGGDGRWGHEVEWSQKNRNRLERLMRAYALDGRYVGAVYYHRPGFNGRRGTRGVVEDAARNVNEWLAGMGRGPCIVTRPLSLVDDVLEGKCVG